MKITVAIVTRNRDQYLKNCLDSLSHQVIKPHTVIVIDNASSDNTKEVIGSFTKKLPVKYIFEKRIGIPYARNKALQQAKGDILAFLDDDITIPSDWLIELVKMHKKYPGVIAIQGNVINLPEENMYSQIKNYYQDLWFKKHADLSFRSNVHQIIEKSEYEFTTLCTRNCSFKLRRIKKMKIKFDENLLIGSDEDLGNRLVMKEKIIFAPSIISFHWEDRTFPRFISNDFKRGIRRRILDEKWGEAPTIKVSDMSFNFFPLSKLILEKRYSILKYAGTFYLHRIIYVSGYLYQKYKKKLASIVKKKGKTDTITNSEKITVILLSWKRPENISKILENLYLCDNIGEIILWNNNPEVIFTDTHKKLLVINSPKNFGFIARWSVAQMARNMHILFLDDDIVLSSRQVKILFSNYLQDTSCIYGCFGRNLEKGKYVFKSAYGNVDIIIGRVMLFNKSHLFTYLQALAKIQVEVEVDLDIIFSLSFKKRHKVINVGAIKELAQAYAVSKGKDHLLLRQEMVDFCRKHIRLRKSMF